MKKITKKAKPAWLLAVAAGAAVVAYVLLVFVPGERARAALNDELDQKHQFVIDCHNTEAQIAEAETELQRTQSFIAAWHASSPSEARLAHVFVDITRHAESAGVDIVRFEPHGIERMEFLERVPVEMACEGNFLQLFTFLGNLESLSPDFWITQMKIDTVATGGERLRCELSLAFFADRREISD